MSETKNKTAVKFKSKTTGKTEECTVEQKPFNCLQVTKDQVYPFKEGAYKGHMVGLATVVLNDQLQIRSLRIMDGANGLFVAYPHDSQDEDFKSIVLPITRELREHIEACVLEKYQYEKSLGD